MHIFTSDKHKLDYKNSKILTQKLQRRQLESLKKNIALKISSDKESHYTFALSTQLSLHFTFLHHIPSQ